MKGQVIYISGLGQDLENQFLQWKQVKAEQVTTWAHTASFRENQTVIIVSKSEVISNIFL